MELLATKIGKDTFVNIQYTEPVFSFINNKKSYQENAVDIFGIKVEVIDRIGIKDVNLELQSIMSINGIRLFDQIENVNALQYSNEGKPISKYYDDLDVFNSQKESDSVVFNVLKIKEK